MKVSRVWRGREGLGRPIRDQFVALGADGALRLAGSVLVADEAGRTSRWNREAVAGSTWIRKTLVVPPGRIRSALLLAHVSCEPKAAALRVQVNGRTLTFRRARGPRPFWDRHWARIPVPPRWLRAGGNDFVFRAEGRSRWFFLVENGCLPDRSAKSLDGGRTWSSEGLGANGANDGEYLVRLRLGRPPARGEIVSEAVDVLALAASGGISPRGGIGRARLAAEGSRPPGTRVEVSWRAGPTPACDPASWTAWTPAGRGFRPPPAARFLQWRLALSPSRSGDTPGIRAVRLDASITLAGPVPRAVVASAKDPPISRGSYPFAALRPDSSRGRILRQRWRLDRLVRGAGPGLPALLRIQRWVRRRWSGGWGWGALNLCPPWDALVILGLCPRGLALGMCTHYSTVLAQCAAALGLPARTVILQGHCACEAWSPEHRKWVLLDPGGDTDDRTRFACHFERDGVPMSALDCHRAWRARAFAGVRIVPDPPPACRERFTLERRLALFERFAISPRNDELDFPEPGEPAHGTTGYHYDGYLWWDESGVPIPWFSRSTSREADLSWEPDRARIHLAAGRRPDVLEVLLEASMPNLASFSTRIDGGPARNRPAAFPWRLHPGENRLEVRPVNGFGREGAAGAVSVRLPPDRFRARIPASRGPGAESAALPGDAPP